jgi:hypothetical protein
MSCVLHLHVAEDDADAHWLGALAGYLRAELLRLGVKAVTPREIMPPPPGGRGIAV